MDSAVRTRIAPTPSGYLHSGNAVGFLLTDMLAWELRAGLLLRIDDLDSARVRPEYVTDIFDSLHWLGIHWSEGPRDPQDLADNWSQVLRLEGARSILHTLRAGGHLFACTCSRTLVDRCTCKDLDRPFDAPDTAWRLRIPDPCPVSYRTWPGGDKELDLARLMDAPILRQRNGLPAYQLASLADDVRFAVDLIVRGEDLLASTVCQLYVASLVDLPSFLAARFVHHPLLTGPDGRKLSKSAGAGSLRSMREGGMGPQLLREEAARMLAGLRAHDP